MTIAPQPAMPVVQTTTRRPQPRLAAAAAAAAGTRRRVLSPVPPVRTGRVLARLTALVLATALGIGLVVSAMLAVASGVITRLG
jgi:hypothetical protein